MPLVVYLVPGQTGAVRRGDIVFQIAERAGNKWKPLWWAHTGIVEETVEGFQLDQSAPVLHMSNFVCEDTWAAGAQNGESRIDACGTFPNLNENDRNKIIDQARAYYQPRPSILKGGHDRSCYWMGDPSPSGHPLYPHGTSLYAFSCSSFAHHCYSEVVGPLVDTSAMPLITEAERSELETVLPKYRIQEGPFRRLYPSYLMHAFRADSYPFSADDWETCKRHGDFIPPEVAA